MDDPNSLLPVESAGNVAGIPPRTLRSWVRSGKLPATEGQRGKLVRLGDVLAIAEMTGRRPALPRHDPGNQRPTTGPATSAGMPPEDAGKAGELPAVTAAARSQLEAIRDEWLRPLIERNEALAERAGRLEAERDQAARERDGLRAEVERLRAGGDAPAAHADAPPPVPGGWRAWWRRLIGGG